MNSRHEWSPIARDVMYIERIENKVALIGGFFLGLLALVGVGLVFAPWWTMLGLVVLGLLCSAVGWRKIWKVVLPLIGTGLALLAVLGLVGVLVYSVLNASIHGSPHPVGTTVAVLVILAALFNAWYRHYGPRIREYWGSGRRPWDNEAAALRAGWRDVGDGYIMGSLGLYGVQPPERDDQLPVPQQQPTYYRRVTVEEGWLNQPMPEGLPPAYYERQARRHGGPQSLDEGWQNRQG